MLTKIKMFIIRIRDKYYTCMYQYWGDKADGFIKLGRYDEAEYCVDMSIKYLRKETDLLVKAFELA